MRPTVISMRRLGVVVAWASLLVASGCVPHHSVATPAPAPERIVARPRPVVALPPDIPWHLHKTRGAGISGYANTTSIAPGDPVSLYVSTSAATFRVAVFRMGWYDGAEGRLVTRTQATVGVLQPAAVIEAPTNTVTAPWFPSLTLHTGTWAPGDYLLRLDASDGSQSYVPLTVRGPTARGRVVLVSPVTTWQAYNRWGCCNLYAGGNGTFATRSRAVSFDRPYEAEHGAGEFLDRELPVLSEAERLHLRLDYVTSIDLEQDPQLLDGATAVISMGHDEYWSPAMRTAVTTARDAGTNLAFLGANAMFRRIRFDATAAGPDRLEIDYKVAAEDPLRYTDPSAVTSDWPDWPDPEPESNVIGASYNCFNRVRTDGVVADPKSPLFRGTGVVAGTHLPGLIGPETDRFLGGPDQPGAVDVLMHSPFPCPPSGLSIDADTTYYTASSGAGVFDSGTLSWVCALGQTCATPQTSAVVQRVTDNLLRLFAYGPASTS